MAEFEKDILMAQRIAAEVAEKGGSVYYVGGYVRDALLHRENKDVDIEVHGIAPAELEQVLDLLGQRLTMGESFGIYGLKGYSLDIAMPRKESQRGDSKHFEESVNPFIGTQQAARRRDFTFNALMQNVLTGEIVDHFGGRKDLEAGILRHVDDETFAEDSLRVLRAAQFASRFGFEVAPETIELCSSLDLSGLAFERIEGEVKKALLKSERPSVFFQTLKKMNQLSEWFPEVEALIGVEQNPRYHAEGDAYTHTMMVLDQAAAYRDRTSNPFGFMLAALVHDFGKAICTETIDGVIHAYRHEIEGLPLVNAFMERITTERKLIEYVLNLTEHHMKPIVKVKSHSSVKSMNKMFDQAVDPEALICIALADDQGRCSSDQAVEAETILYEALNTYRDCMARPYVMGRELVEAGLKPGENFAELLAYAHKLRLAFVPKENALKQTLAYARQMERRSSTGAEKVDS